jgi:YidC/Oxa1 family membrane protein insertase
VPDYLLNLLHQLAGLLDGSLGWAILALSLAVRVALLPLTLHGARQMLRNQTILVKMKVELEAIRTRLRDQPRAMAEEVGKLYRKHGYAPLDRATLLGSLAQLPVFGFLYQAIKDASAAGAPFLWMRSLSSPDNLLTLLVLVLSAASAWFFPSTAESSKALMVWAQVLITGLCIFKLGAGAGLYWLASSGVSLGQTLYLRWHARPRVAAQP